jgi:hypothetical protein
VNRNGAVSVKLASTRSQGNIFAMALPGYLRRDH